MSAPNAMEIYIPSAGGRCRVVVGAARRAYYSTPALVGMALLSQHQPQGGTPLGSVSWCDHLASHGIATGHQSENEFTLAVIPPTKRTINHTSRNEATMTTETRQRVITFPHMLVGLHLRAGRFVKGLFYLTMPTVLPTLHLNVTTPVATSFPYGNVYQGTGRICWGTIRHDGIRSLGDLLTLFFESGFNRDLYHAGEALSTAAARPDGVLTPPTAGHLNLPMTTIVGTLIGAGA